MTLMKEIKPVVTVKLHFDNGEQSFLKTSFWKFWTIKILMQGSISKVLQTNPTLQEYGFQLRPFWKKLDLWLRRNMRSNIDKSKKHRLLGVSGFNGKKTSRQNLNRIFFCRSRVAVCYRRKSNLQLRRNNISINEMNHFYNTLLEILD